jgi:transposase InsO family protein
VPILAENGTYVASASSFYRVLKQEGLIAGQKPRRTAKAQVPDKLAATAINQLWSWDISYLKTNIRGSWFYLYLFMDIFSRAIMGWEIHETENGEASSALFARLCAQHKAKGVTLHSDNGNPMRCSQMLRVLQELGAVASFSRPSVSDDNPYSESLFKTLKYTAGYPKSFQTICEAQTWMTNFVQWYNHVHRHSKIQYVTPMQRHTGQDQLILSRRQAVFTQARAANPSRWSAQQHSWERPQLVYLKRPNRNKAKEKTAA